MDRPMVRKKEILRTTYQDDFSSLAKVEAPLSFFQEPCLYSNEEKLDPRCFPISLPRFPNRKRDGDLPIAAGFETYVHRRTPSCEKASLADDQPASRTSLTEELCIGLPNIIVEELVKLASYTPSSRLHDFTTPEKKTRVNKLIKHDTSTVRYKPIVNNKQPEIWQKVGCVWDKVQERSTFTPRYKETRNIEGKPSTRLLSRPRVQENNRVKQNTPKEGDPYYYANIPGYGGYQPRLPQVAKTSQQMQSSATVIYRNQARVAYRLPQYAHNGPLSRTVTLTQPCNPFNKVTKQRITVS